MRVLALDQATYITGFSYWIDGKMVECGTLNEESAKNKKKPIVERMNSMSLQIDDILKNHEVDFVCIEGVQYQSNQKVYSQLSQLQGMIFKTLLLADIGFCVVEPKSWKSFCGVAGKNRADEKEHTMAWVKEKFGVSLGEDIADSIGIGWWAINNLVQE